MADSGSLQTSVNRLGWHNEAFVLPDAILANEEYNEVLVFQSRNAVEHEFKESGTLPDWQARVAKICVGNSRLLFALSSAFAASVMRLVDAECGIIHYVGLSSTGKSTALRAAASVFGSKKSVRNWRSTANGLEGTIALHNDLLLILDELGQANPKDIGEIVYLIGNGSGKIRAGRDGSVRAVSQWLTLVLSSGETTLSAHMASVGAKVKGGQQVRCLDIPADAGSGLGAFENLHGRSNPGLFADEITRASAQVYGVAGRAFLARVVEDMSEVRRWLRDEIQRFVADQKEKHDLAGASGEIHRALSRFALVAAGGELATRFLITGWSADEARKAASKCFAAWLSQRGRGANDVELGIRRVKAFIEQHGASRFQDIKAEDESRFAQRTFNRVGFVEKHAKGNTYYFLPEIFRTEVCAGYDHEAILKDLKREGHLRYDNDRLTYKRTLPDLGKKGTYAILPSLFAEPDGRQGVDFFNMLEDAA